MVKTVIFLVIFICKLVLAKHWSCPTLNNAITQDDILHAAYASNESYEDDVIEGTLINKTPYKVVKRIHTNLFTDAGIRVLVADSGNTRMIVYRGTDGQSQLLVEGASMLKKKAVVDYGKHAVKIMQFFWDAFEVVSYDLRPYITDPSKKYIITGHSLGGALASIMALNGTQLFKGSIWANPKSSLITFGQPRTGDSAYADLHDSLISTYRKLRFVYKGDAVARNPPRSLGYRHHSRAVYMGEEKVRKSWLSWLGRDSPNIMRGNSAVADNENEDMLDEDAELFPDAALEYLSEEEDESEQQDSKMRSFWTICSSQRAFFCITHLKHIMPTWKDHGIVNYIKSTEETHVFRNRKGTEKNEFNKELVATCRQLG